MGTATRSANVPSWRSDSSDRRGSSVSSPAQPGDAMTECTMTSLPSGSTPAASQPRTIGSCSSLMPTPCSVQRSWWLSEVARTRTVVQPSGERDRGARRARARAAVRPGRDVQRSRRTSPQPRFGFRCPAGARQAGSITCTLSPASGWSGSTPARPVAPARAPRAPGRDRRTAGCRSKSVSRPVASSTHQVASSAMPFGSVK